MLEAQPHQARPAELQLVHRVLELELGMERPVAHLRHSMSMSMLLPS